MSFPVYTPPQAAQSILDLFSIDEVKRVVLMTGDELLREAYYDLLRRAMHLTFQETMQEAKKR